MQLLITQKGTHWINMMFESQMAWSFDNGIFYFSGRDVVAIMIGLVAGIILMLIIKLLEGSDKE